MDPTPFFGRMIDLHSFGKAGEEGVLLLMSDSTNVERHEHTMSESIIYQKFEQLFAAAEGLTIVSMFASNVGRMGQVFDIARKLEQANRARGPLHGAERAPGRRRRAISRMPTSS